MTMNMIKLRTLALLIACAMATPAGAQKTAAQVTDAQIAEYKIAAQKACEDGGKTKGDPAEKVSAFCGCLIDVMNKNMKPSEWQQAVLFSRTNRPDDERKVIAPSLKQLDTCRPEAPPPAASTPAPTGGAGLSGGRSGAGLTPPAKSSQGLR